MNKLLSLVLVSAMVAGAVMAAEDAPHHLRASLEADQNQDTPTSWWHRYLWGMSGWGRPPKEPDSIAELAEDTSDLSTLYSLLEEAGLVETLDGDGTFTVFAPTNDAFDAASLASDADVESILLYHVLGDRILRTVGRDFKNGGPWTTLNGGELETSAYRAGRTGPYVKMVNDAEILDSISASNGVVHIIDAVLIPLESASSNSTTTETTTTTDTTTTETTTTDTTTTETTPAETPPAETPPAETPAETPPAETTP